MQLTLPDGSTLDLTRPRIVGVLNVTPDSFSDGGRFGSGGTSGGGGMSGGGGISGGGSGGVRAAAAAALAMARAGADVIDVGGESTRPGAERVPAGQQRQRVVPVIEAAKAACAAAGLDAVAFSIDTTRAEVAAAAVDAGAAIVNDVSAGRDDPAILALAAERGTPYIAMHMLGSPATMQQDPRYDDVVAEVEAFLLGRAAAAEAAGVPGSQVVIDPGIGFGKTLDHNLALLAALPRFVATGRAVLLGASRKRFIAAVSAAAGRPEPPDAAPAAHRLGGTVATTALAVAAGVQLIRVHDVAANRQAADVAHAVRRASGR